jgi:hypothetical protein
MFLQVTGKFRRADQGVVVLVLSMLPPINNITSAIPLDQFSDHRFLSLRDRQPSKLHAPIILAPLVRIA